MQEKEQQNSISGQKEEGEQQIFDLLRVLKDTRHVPTLLQSLSSLLWLLKLQLLCTGNFKILFALCYDFILVQLDFLMF